MLGLFACCLFPFCLFFFDPVDEVICEELGEGHGEFDAVDLTVLVDVDGFEEALVELAADGKGCGLVLALTVAEQPLQLRAVDAAGALVPVGVLVNNDCTEFFGLVVAGFALGRDREAFLSAADGGLFLGADPQVGDGFGSVSMTHTGSRFATASTACGRDGVGGYEGRRDSLIAAR